MYISQPNNFGKLRSLLEVIYIDAQTYNNPAKILIFALEHSTKQYLHFTHNDKSANMSHALLHKSLCELSPRPVFCD